MTIRVTSLPKIPARPVEGHKGIFGRVLVVGGSEGMIGAPALAGRAALRSGAGLVQLAVPRAILSACLTIAPELIGLGLGRAAGKDALLQAAEAADAVVIGPGLGTNSEAKDRLTRLIRLPKPTVIDADGLNILANESRWPAYLKVAAVLTPHPGEMKRLAKFFTVDPDSSGDSQRVDLAVEAANTFAQVVVLKGHETVVTDGARVYVNHTGDSSLSKAGTGDVLCGVLAALLAQGVERFDAACAAVWIHGKAGELAGQILSRRGVLAGDVIDHLPHAFSMYERT